MADQETVTSAEDEKPVTVDDQVAMRDKPHEYVDNSGWCRQCGRSSSWSAHPQATDKKVTKKLQSPALPAETKSIPGAPSDVATTMPSGKKAPKPQNESPA